MTDALTDIIADFDSHMAQYFTSKQYGLCELVNGQGEIYPVTSNQVPRRERVSPADNWQLQTYHRVLTANRVSSLDEFGRQKEFFVNVRHVLIGNVNLGEGFVFRYLDKFPDLIVTPGGFAVVEDAWAVNLDHPAIAAIEFGPAWEDKHRLTKNIWMIEWTFKLTVDPDCAPKPTL